MLNILEFKDKYNYSTLSPIIRQYLDIKFEHQNNIVLFCIGEFYEIFFEDAVVASKILGITLTARGRGENRIPMCGVPACALENYLYKLTSNGLKVTVCDQVASPAKESAKSGLELVKREVVKIVTQGAITEESVLNTEISNYLISIVCNESSNFAIAYFDLSTFEFKVMSLGLSEISSELARLNPREILISQNLSELQIFDEYRNIITIKEFEHNSSLATKNSLLPLQQLAANLIISYVEYTQRTNLMDWPDPEILKCEEYMTIDASSMRSLEILKNLNGGMKHTLLSSMNATMTKHGSRLLAQYLSKPLINQFLIKERLNKTEYFYNNFNLTGRMRNLLKESNDLERIVTKIAASTAKPCDLLALKKIIEIYNKISSLLLKSEGLNAHRDKLFSYNFPRYQDEVELLSILKAAIKEDCQNGFSEGGYINPSYHPKLDEINEILEESKLMIEKMHLNYCKTTGIESLKLVHNNVLGLFIEVGLKHAAKMNDSRFIHLSTTASAARFTTEGLKQVANSMISNKALTIGLEKEIFEQICCKIRMQSNELRSLAQHIAELDVFCSLAFVAKTYGYVKPKIADGREFLIIKGRHLIAERNMEANCFVANDCDLSSSQKLWLITGPNMGGKSTFLRQNAIIAILAQAGSFVPAIYAKVGIIDKLFSRISFGDDIAKGQSTFMVEMLEMANILNSATSESLIIIDEIGRGTAAHDGLAIAQSCLEYIHNKIQCRCLFATHFHELTDLKNSLTNMRNFSTEVVKDKDKLSFTHRITSGSALKSYGIYVAELAGMPQAIINRAKEIIN